MKKYKIILFLTIISLLQFSCKKEFDLPPVKPIESLNKINIANIKMKYSSGINYQFKGDSSLYCLVTADEVSGNLFKEIYVKDPTGALHVRLVNSGGIFIGDSIRINLKGVILNDNNKLIQLDSVDSEKNIIKLASGYDPQPLTLTIAQIIANTSATNSIQSKLVKIENAEFVTADQNQTFADAFGHAPLTRVLKACTSQTLAVRTSGYSNFAGKSTPVNNGSITGIVSQYGSSMQLILRSYDEVIMTNALCSSLTTSISGTTYLDKNFNDNSLTSRGWNSFIVTNTSIKWSIGTFSNTPTPFAKISGYSGGANTASENWLISPALNLSSAIDPVLTFQTAAKFAGIPLDVLVSLNYNSGNPSSANWTSLSSYCSLSPASGNYAWTSSGTVSLGAYKSANVHIAFKYSSSASGATTYELDDVLVKEK